MSRFIEENNLYKNQQKQLQKNQRMPPGMPSQDMMAYWGSPWDPTTREEIESRDELVVNNNAQYCSIVLWDCKPARKEDVIHWVELKTSAEIRNDRDMVKYERKLLKFWAQSFLLGIPKIIVGFRDERGIVHRLEELETASIPNKVKNGGRVTWDGNICINFTSAFLECRISQGVWYFVSYTNEL
ncbi:unnamed protein product [Aspergillus oryzae]|nr:unnamed protein product [Aspergillus oryzae]GMF91154.1 unnamed protein product [Aspergillus oryzae]